jgi:hypothetical protein
MTLTRQVLAARAAAAVDEMEMVVTEGGRLFYRALAKQSVRKGPRSTDKRLRLRKGGWGWRWQGGFQEVGAPAPAPARRPRAASACPNAPGVARLTAAHCLLCLLCCSLPAAVCVPSPTTPPPPPPPRAPP